MAVTVSQVLASRPEALVGAAAEVASATAQIDAEIASQRHSLTRLAADWTGPASASAQGSAQETLGDLEIYRDRTQALHKQLATSGKELSRIRTDLTARVDGPESRLFDIADTGHVEFGKKLKLLVVVRPYLAMKYGMHRLELQTAIQTALAKFDAADQSCASQLRKINQGMAR